MKPVLAVRHVSHEGLGTISAALARRQVPYTIRRRVRGDGVSFRSAGVLWPGGDGRADEC